MDFEDNASQRVVTGAAWEEDMSFDNVLRPKTMEEYIGQERVKEKLRIYIEAARHRSEQLDHVLLYGPPGLGKTTLANIIAAQMGVNIRVTSGPALEKPKDLYGIIYNVGEHGVLFIDEIHRLSKTVEEYLYPAMEDFMLEWVTGQGAFAATQRQPLPRFTLVGATTRAGMISKPLRDRFGIVERMELYTQEELMRIIRQSAGKLGMEIRPSGAEEIARRSRGTPRVANRLLKRVRDFAQVEADGVIDEIVAHRALSMLEVDQLGLDRTDRQILEAIIQKFDGGPVGLDTLAAATGEENITIEDVYEPYLMQLGFLSRTPRGRVATRRCYEHLGLPVPRALAAVEEDQALEQLRLET